MKSESVNRLPETILGVTGGIIGVLSALFVLFIGGIGEAFGANDGPSIVALGLVAVVLSILGLVGGSIVKINSDVAGVMMVIAGIGGFIAISFGFIVAGPLLVIAGTMALVRNS